MKRIIIHWSAGKYNPNQTDKTHYHYLIDANGNITNGYYTPEDNLNCADGRYAAHTGGGNTSSIGVVMCAMYGYKSPKDIGDFPMTKIQFEACMCLCAELCEKYHIEITPDTVLTHYEFGQKHRTTASFGKIDITYLPPYPWVCREDVGSFIRSKIRWYKNNKSRG